MSFQQTNYRINPFANNNFDIDVTTANFLGLLVDSNMKWQSNIEYTCIKINQFSFA